MSSDYMIFCLSHDPAIETGGERGAEEVITQAMAGLTEHPGCDLLIARYSGGLVELGCPGQVDPQARHHHPGWHREIIWAEAGLLRVAAALVEHVIRDPGDVIADALKRMPMCWTAQRLHRLRYVLEVA